MADTYDFPDDLLKARHELQVTREELSAVLGRLPRHPEPLEAYTDWRGVDHPASEGWSEADFAAVNALRARETELAVHVHTHEFWATLRRNEVVAARMALKHVRDRPGDASAAPETEDPEPEDAEAEDPETEDPQAEDPEAEAEDPETVPEGPDGGAADTVGPLEGADGGAAPGA